MTRTNLRPQLVALFILIGIGFGVLGLFAFQHEINKRLNNSSWTSNHFILNTGDGQFLVDANAMVALDISGRVNNAPLLSEMRISKTERSIGRWTFVNYDGKVLLERTTSSYLGLYAVEYFDASQLVVFSAEQSFMCEQTPLSIDHARDGFVGSILILQDLTGDGRVDAPVIFRTFVPNSPGESTADLEPACPVR